VRTVFKPAESSKRKAADSRRKALIDLRNTIYFEINAETWNFFKQSLPIQNSDQYWASILTRGEEIVKKYENTQQSQFAKDQVFAIISELERIRRAGSFDSLRPGTEKN
jgi:hypothetical protein